MFPKGLSYQATLSPVFDIYILLLPLDPFTYYFFIMRICLYSHLVPSEIFGFYISCHISSTADVLH